MRQNNSNVAHAYPEKTKRYVRAPNEDFNAYIRHNLIVSGASNIEKKTILDLGCGLGILGRYFEKKRALLVYADMTLDFLKHFPKTKYLGERILCDGRCLPFVNSSFDLVLCSDVVEHVHVSQREDFLAEIARVAKSNVLITISTFTSTTLGVSLFTRTFEILRLPYPEWYVEHCLNISPQIHEIITFFKNKKMELIEMRQYQGILSVFLTGILSALLEVRARVKKKSRMLFSAIIVICNPIFYIMSKSLDFPPYCSFYLKLRKNSVKRKK